MADCDIVTAGLHVAMNVRAPFFLVRELVPGMIERGAGVVINIGSWISTVGLPSGALYGASKAMLEQASRGWAAEFGRAGVRVNTLAPGVTLTDGTLPAKEQLEGMVARIPSGRLALPGEIAKAAVFLASDEAAYMHASTLLIDGGALSTRLA